MTFVAKCDCKNEDQNKLYGIGLRLFNVTDTKNGKGRCTVCGKAQK